MAAYTVDTAASHVVIHTRAEGLLARLAHDLELAARDVSGTAALDGDVWKAELRVHTAEVRVVGAVHGDRVDTGTLSASERSDIERKMREDVFGSVTAIVVKAAGMSRHAGEATLIVGKAHATSPLTLSAEELPNGDVRADGHFAVSLDAIGAKPIKGPLGAFRVKDAVEVAFKLTLRAAH